MEEDDEDADGTNIADGKEINHKPTLIGHATISKLSIERTLGNIPSDE